MAASGDTVEMKVTFERPLTDKKVAERCRAIARLQLNSSISLSEGRTALFRGVCSLRKCLRLLLPQHLDALLDVIKDKAAHVAVVVRPLSVLRVGAASGRWWMEVIP